MKFFTQKFSLNLKSKSQQKNNKKKIKKRKFVNKIALNLEGGLGINPINSLHCYFNSFSLLFFFHIHGFGLTFREIKISD